MRGNVNLGYCGSVLMLCLVIVSGWNDGYNEVSAALEGRAKLTGRRRCISYDDDVKLAEGNKSVTDQTGDVGDFDGNQNQLQEKPRSRQKSTREKTVTEMVCSKESEFCYALWEYATKTNGSLIFKKQGCWEPGPGATSCQSSQCVSTAHKHRRGSKQEEKETTHDATSLGAGENFLTQKPAPFFCCCGSDNCNADVEHKDYEEHSDEEEYLTDTGEDHHNWALGLVILCTGGVAGVCILLLGFRSWKKLLRRQLKDREADGETGVDGDGEILGLSGEGKLLLGGVDEGESLLGTTANGGMLDGMQLVVLLAKGKFTSVYEGRIPSLSDSPFALKCFAKEQKEFFENERFVFSYLGKNCSHENIIKYYGWQEFTVGPTTHLILVLDKICPGSLRDYLQSVTMTVEQSHPSSTPENPNENNPSLHAQTTIKIVDVLRICSGIASGLSYLHGENRDEVVIAHRDLTSKNILLDSSTLTPKITDFGLSLVTRGSKYYWAGRERQAEFCSLAEAGTLRYMAPELLEGAVNLKDCENALKQADIYALALILWEVANCSTDVRLTQSRPQEQSQGNEENRSSDSLQVETYHVEHSLPYEEEIGKDTLTMDALSRHVVQYRQRPHFRRWRDSPYTRQLRDTLIESWDAEPDARLTALCIVERLHDIRHIRPKNSDISKGAVHQFHGQALQSPLESPTTGLFNSDRTVPILIESPWTGRNPCLQRNLLANNTASSTSGGEGLSTSASVLSGTMGRGLGNGMQAHPLLLNHFDLSKNQANLNYYHNYVGGSSGGTSYTGSTTGDGHSPGNVTEVSNVSSVTEEQVGASSAARCPSTTITAAQTQNTHLHHLPPSIPFLQNLHN